MTLQHLRERLTFLFLLLLPLHALLVTVLTKLVFGADHPPWGVFAAWKEILLLAIVAIALVELLRHRERLKTFDLFDGLICGLVLLGVVVSLSTESLASPAFLYGFKYDFVPLLAFLVLRRVAWSHEWLERALRMILLLGGALAVYGLLALVLPDAFFTFLGYSSRHSLYIPDHPLAAISYISGATIPRMQSTFSGPNQMAMWMLLPWSLSLLSVMGRSIAMSIRPRLISLIFVLSGLSILLSFSRSVWIAALIIVIAAAWKLLAMRAFRLLIEGIGLFLLIGGIAATVVFPSVIVRLSSSRGHLQLPLQALGKMVDAPLGSGLGTAGPATNRTSDACVLLRPQDDPTWAKAYPDLCVFVGDKQVQPEKERCNCPFNPENWYLQMGVEMGFLGCALFVALTALVLWRLRLSMGESLGIGLFFFGVSVAALFLHAWEDAAVAYTGWVLLSATLPLWTPPSTKAAS